MWIFPVILLLKSLRYISVKAHRNHESWYLFFYSIDPNSLYLLLTCEYSVMKKFGYKQNESIGRWVVSIVHGIRILPTRAYFLVGKLLSEFPNLWEFWGVSWKFLGIVSQRTSSKSYTRLNGKLRLDSQSYLQCVDSMWSQYVWSKKKTSPPLIVHWHEQP